MAELVINAKDIVRDQMEMTIYVRVVNLRWVKFRLWIACRLCGVAAWIGGYGLKINQEVGVIVTDVSPTVKKVDFL